MADEVALPRVRNIGFSPDGKFLAAATNEPKSPGGVTVWDVARRKVCFEYLAKDGCSSVVYSPDGQLLAVGGNDGAVRIFDVSSRKERSVLQHTQPVRSVAFNMKGDLLASAGDDKTVRFWDHAAQKETKSLGGPMKSIRAIALSPDGKMIIAGADDAAHVWDVQNERLKASLNHDGQGVPLVLFAPDSKAFVTAGHDGRVIVWDAKEMLPRFTLRGSGGVFGLAYCEKTEMLVVASWRRVLLRGLTFREPTLGDSQHVDQLLAQLDADPLSEREAASDALQKLGPNAVTMLAKAATESKSAEIRMRARKIREKVLSTYDLHLTCDDADVVCVAIAPDGKNIAGGGRNGFVYIWDTATMKQVARLQPGPVK